MGVLQLKRATAERWLELNPVLAVGEPGFEYTTNKLKIGDGILPWNELPYLNEEHVVNAQTHYDFPSIGKQNVIYKAEDEKLVYQWNSTELQYEVLNTIESDVPLDIELINGGGASS